MYFEHKIYKLLNEEDVMDKMIKFKDAEGNEKEATVGGILKKGEDHPAHDLAQKELDNAKGDSEDKPSRPSIDANPFDDKEKEPSAAPKSYDNPMDGIEVEKEALADLFNKRKEDPEDFEAHDEMQDKLMDIFKDDSLVTAVMEDGVEDYDSPEEFIDQLKGEAEMMMDESKTKQPFREHYNRLFKGRSVL